MYFWSSLPPVSESYLIGVEPIPVDSTDTPKFRFLENVLSVEQDGQLELDPFRYIFSQCSCASVMSGVMWSYFADAEN